MQQEYLLLLQPGGIPPIVERPANAEGSLFPFVLGSRSLPAYPILHASYLLLLVLLGDLRNTK